MVPILRGRLCHYALLLLVTASLFLPNLGVPSLWDIDEGNNAECAFEMWSRGDGITPYFNGDFRVDKPALLYWCQMAAYRVCGVNEFAARLPSALAALLTVLLTYELGRRLFDANAAVLAGLILASTLLFCGMAHFANPDALLNVCTVLTFLLFWSGFVSGSSGWLAWGGISTGLGFLAKGPVGLVLPMTVIGLFLLWMRQLRHGLRMPILLGVLLWVVVAVPWFALVGCETKGVFLRGFFIDHNLKRGMYPMEGHGGPFYYHALSVFLGFLPWSVYFGLTLANTLREVRSNEPSEARAATRFLCCWIAVYLVFFSVSRTKLPNYVLPLYPALALLTGRAFDRWRHDRVTSPFLMRLLPWGPVGWALVGLGAAVGLLIVSGVSGLPQLRHPFPELRKIALLGVLPVLGATAAWLFFRRQAQGSMIASLGVSAVLFVGGLFFWGAAALDAEKAPRPLVTAAGCRQLERDIRIGCYDYFQPSLVFYSGRRVDRFNDEGQVREFLQAPLPVYLFVPEPSWQNLAPRMPATVRLRGRHWDLYRRCEVLVISNAVE